MERIVTFSSRAGGTPMGLTSAELLQPPTPAPPIPPAEGARPATRSVGAIVAVAGFVLFVAAMILLVVASVSRRAVSTFAPPASCCMLVRGGAGGVDTVTVDARDVHAWRYVRLAHGGPDDGTNAHGAWDVAVRRYHVVPAIAAANLGALAFDGVARGPSGGFVSSRFAHDTTNAATARWYRYSWSTHVLEPGRQVYVVRTRDGRDVKLEMLSYYCTGVRAGCVTFRWAELSAR